MKKIDFKVFILIFIILCFVSGFIVQKYYGKSMDNATNSDDRIAKISIVELPKDVMTPRPTTRATATPRPTATAFKCEGKTIGDCSSGQASSYCSWCKGGCHAKSDCPTPKPTSKPPATSNPNCYISELSPGYLSTGDTYSITVTTTCSRDLTYTITNGTVSSLSDPVVNTLGSETKYIYQLTVVAGKQCKMMTIDLASGSKTKTININIRSTWKPYRDIYSNEPLPMDRRSANWQSVDIKGNCKSEKYNGKTRYYCTGVEIRSGCGCTGCPPIDGQEPPSTPEPKYSYCCVDNQLPGLSTNVFYVEDKPTKDCSTYAISYNKPSGSYTLLENYSKDQCKAPEPVTSTCSTSNTSVPKQAQARACEGSVLLRTDDNISCTGFYTISCRKTIETSFDYGNDYNPYTLRYVYQGEGIEYGIGVRTNTNCQLRFNETTWLNAYNKFIGNIGLIDSGLITYVRNNNASGWQSYIDSKFSSLSKANKSILYGWWNIISNLRSIVTTYNNYELSIISNNGENENGTLSLTTKENGKSVTISSNFDLTVENKRVSRVVRKVESLGLSGLKNPKDYDLDLLREIKLLPKNTCVSKYSGEVELMGDTKTCTDDKIVGGNKVYVGYSVDPADYDIKIVVGGLGLNNSTVTNAHCDVKVLGGEILYRPVELSNPFISNSWKKGENWVNAKYDFTQTIHEKTWQETTRNVINISANEISEIKSSNASYEKSNYSPYLGICDAVKKKTAIDEKICKAIK